MRQRESWGIGVVSAAEMDLQSDNPFNKAIQVEFESSVNRGAGGACADYKAAESRRWPFKST